MARKTKMNPFEQAIDHVKKRYVTLTGEPLSNNHVISLLDCSHTWYFKCLRDGSTSLPMALKLDKLTDGHVTWDKLCPLKAKEILQVTGRVKAA